MEMNETQGTGGPRPPSAGHRLESEYRQIVSAFDEIVRLHVESLSRVLGAVGPSGPSRTFEGTARKGRAVDGTQDPSRGGVIELAGHTRRFLEAAVEGRPIP